MRVLFYPELPDREGYTIVSICHELGYQGVATLDEAFDLAFTWQDRAWLDPQPVLEAIAARVPVWNLWCRDVGKRRVEAAARAVMGYGLEVDPTVYAGPCAMRPVDGGRGFLVHAPVERPEGGYVYQRRVVCTQSGRPAHYRVSVVAGEIPVCYVIERAPMHEHLRTPVQTAELPEFLSTPPFAQRNAKRTGLTKLCDRSLQTRKLRNSQPLPLRILFWHTW